MLHSQKVEDLGFKSDVWGEDYIVGERSDDSQKRRGRRVGRGA
jgi:hypothetical protein